MKKRSAKSPIPLVGLTKREVLEILGDEFNYYPSKQWEYYVKRKWWQRKSTLYIVFDEEDKVITQFII